MALFRELTLSNVSLNILHIKTDFLNYPSKVQGT